MSLFVIRCKKTGHLSSGGQRIRFNETGKIWTNKQGLHLHLTSYGKNVYTDQHEVVEVSLADKAKTNADLYVTELLERLQAKHAKKEETQNQRLKEAKLSQAKQLIEEASKL